MKLTLDHTQRLNLHALLGAQRADVGSIRAIWSIQDRIALDTSEEKTIELKREMVAGAERVVWNPASSIPVKEFEFSDPEVARIRVAIQTIGGGVVPWRRQRRTGVMQTQALTDPGHIQVLAVVLSIVTAAATGMNVYIGLRLAALQSKMKADSSALEASLIKQFVGWKDEVLAAINGKYVSAALIAEIRNNLGRELAQIEARLEHIENRCEMRQRECLLAKRDADGA
jgi:hypothetical protein